MNCLLAEISHPPTRRQEPSLNFSLWFWGAVLVVGHALYANTPFVNLEFAFSEAARGLTETGYTAGFDKYWSCQANPLGYSAITAGLIKTLHLPDAFWVYRLPSFLGGVGILVSGWIICRKIGSRAIPMFSLWAALTTLNPLVWVYGGRATADVLPAGLMCLAFAACFVARGRLSLHLLAGALFSLAIVVKFNSILLGLGFVYLVFAPGAIPNGDLQENVPVTLRRKLTALACYTILPGLVLSAYFAWTWRSFGVLLVADGPMKTLDPSGFVNQFPATFAMYWSYLATMLGLLALIVPARIYQGTPRGKAVVISIATVGIAGLCSWGLMNFNAGEMDYGGFNHMLPQAVFSLLRVGCLALAIFLIGDLLQNALQQQERFASFLAAALIPYLVISSFFRPAQRYLILCLPFVLLYLLLSAPLNLQRLTRWLGWPTAGVYALISFVAVVYQVGQGRAAESMAQWIAAHGQLDETSPGAILPHAGQHFPVQDASNKLPATTLIVQTQPAEPCLHSETVKVFGRVLRTYYLCPKAIPNVAARDAVPNGPY